MAGANWKDTDEVIWLDTEVVWVDAEAVLLLPLSVAVSVSMYGVTPSVSKYDVNPSVDQYTVTVSKEVAVDTE
jgi:hypothetical protein